MVYKRVSKIIFAAILAVTVFSGCKRHKGVCKRILDDEQIALLMSGMV